MELRGETLELLPQRILVFEKLVQLNIGKGISVLRSPGRN